MTPYKRVLGLRLERNAFSHPLNEANCHMTYCTALWPMAMRSRVRTVNNMQMICGVKIE